LESFKCSFKECKQSDVVEMNCVICKKHFCLEHRHHECLDAPASQSKREKMQAPKEQFRKAKAESDKLVG
jgi:predicted nucleic acid binding AN1-type Zn finger protein